MTALLLRHRDLNRDRLLAARLAGDPAAKPKPRPLARPAKADDSILEFRWQQRLALARTTN